MGYTTEFFGKFEFSRELTNEEDDILLGLSDPPQKLVDRPNYYCQWIPSNDRKYLRWDGGEKFYDYVEWLEYIIKNYLQPWGIFLNGEVEFQGERRDDAGKIVVTSNEVKTFKLQRVYEINKISFELKEEEGD